MRSIASRSSTWWVRCWRSVRQLHRHLCLQVISGAFRKTLYLPLRRLTWGSTSETTAQLWHMKIMDSEGMRLLVLRRIYRRSESKFNLERLSLIEETLKPLRKQLSGTKSPTIEEASRPSQEARTTSKTIVLLSWDQLILDPEREVATKLQCRQSKEVASRAASSTGSKL